MFESVDNQPANASSSELRTPKSDRRRHVRYPTSAVTIARIPSADGPAAEARSIARLTDVSLRGVGLTLYRAAEVGSMLLLDASRGGNTLWAQYRVIRSVRNEGANAGYAIGAELVRAAPGHAEEILAAFVAPKQLAAALDEAAQTDRD